MFSSFSKNRKPASTVTTTRKGRRSGDYRRAAGLAVESLEGRALMAGDVSAVVNGAGELVINGDANSNGVQVTQINATTFSVGGTPAGGSATRVNGSFAPRVIPNVTSNVRVNLSGGHDELRIGGLSDANRMVLPGSLIVSGGEGDDTVFARYLNMRDNRIISIDTGAGADTVSLDRVVNRSTVDITTGTQDDTVSVANSTIFNRLAVTTSAGNDRLTVANSVMDNFRADMGTGDDNVTVDRNLSWLSAFVDGGDGWDRITGSNAPWVRKVSIA